jgi:hypothetical protein
MSRIASLESCGPGTVHTCGHVEMNFIINHIDMRKYSPRVADEITKKKRQALYKLNGLSHPARLLSRMNNIYHIEWVSQYVDSHP